MEEVEKYLKKLGYEENDIKEIVNSYPLRGFYPETVLNNIKRNYDFLISIGYSQEDIIKMTKTLPSIYGYSIENMKQKIEALKELGYNQEEIIKMTKVLPAIYSLSIENMKQKIEYLKELGYSQEDIIKMTKTLPSIYSHSIENIKQKIENLKELGYSQEDVIKMTKVFPSIYSLSIENMKQKIEDLKKLGYSQEDVIKMTKVSPSIYGLSIENIKQKVEFYDSIKLHSLAIIAPKALMQSTALSYARYMFYKEKGINIDETNYKKLFMDQKKFEKQYGEGKKELLERYNYRDYLESLDKRKGIKSTQELGQETIKEQGNTEQLDNIEREQKVQQQALADKTQETK